MSIPFYQVDAFTDRPFSGNPAGVVLLDAPRDPRWMQQIASEMNLPETAFVTPSDDGFQLRWFSPVTEVDLCGHATLAAAHILYETAKLAADAEARFHTRAGVLSVQRKFDLLAMDFPAEIEQPIMAPFGLGQGLGIAPQYVGRNRFDYLVMLGSETAVRSIKPDFRTLAQIDTRGIIVTAVSDSPEYDFISRFFAPRLGIDEDPATGSAHCCLAPFWAKRLNKSELVAYQASRRGGMVRMTHNGDRVLLSGQAVTIIQGQLL